MTQLVKHLTLFPLHLRVMGSTLNQAPGLAWSLLEIPPSPSAYPTQTHSHVHSKKNFKKFTAAFVAKNIIHDTE